MSADAATAPPSPADAAAPPAPVTLREAFGYWLKLGFISFGGPAGQIALMHADLVERRRWISERRFLHALNYCMLLPGPEATQLAAYIGFLMHRTAGALVAGGLFVLPSLVLLALLAWIYMRWGSVPAIAALLYGVKPAVVAIVLHAAWRVGSRVLHHPLLWAIAAAAFVAIFIAGLPFPLIVLGAAVLGTVGARFAPQAFAARASHGSSDKRWGAALIDDDTPTPPHARWSVRRAVTLCLAFGAVWAVALGALALAFGPAGTLTQMGWFFTKAALLTFGGAYAVLPYVTQAAVEQYQWLSAPQMIDGLALGETTPGPLIMIVAFVGFVGGWTTLALGPDAAAAAGIAGAVVATFFTFLPSFFFILLGAPFIETTHGELRFVAPLAGITAAVVGVIVNLGLYFALQVFWPDGLVGPIDLAAAAIAAVALVALLRFKVGVIPLIGACAVAGLVVRLAWPALTAVG
jgi:chromate transporter